MAFGATKFGFKEGLNNGLVVFFAGKIRRERQHIKTLIPFRGSDLLRLQGRTSHNALNLVSSYSHANTRTADENPPCPHTRFASVGVRPILIFECGVAVILSNLVSHSFCEVRIVIIFVVCKSPTIFVLHTRLLKP